MKFLDGKSLKFDDGLDLIKTNANKILEDRSNRKMPGKIGTYKVTGEFGTDAVKEAIKDTPGSDSIKKLYKGDKFLGGTIGSDQTLRVKGKNGNLRPVDLSNDPYGSLAIANTTEAYTKMKGETRKEYNKVTKDLTKKNKKVPVLAEGKSLMKEMRQSLKGISKDRTKSKEAFKKFKQKQRPKKDTSKKFKDSTQYAPGVSTGKRKRRGKKRSFRYHYKCTGS